MPAPLGLGIVGVDHVGLAVPDLDEAVEFHRRVLGAALRHREVNPEQGVAEAMLGWGSGPLVQLLAPLDDASPVARFLRRHGPGQHHVAYRVGDLDAATAAARAAGMDPVFAAARRGTSGSTVNFLHPRHTGGVLIELVQPAP